jgi:hypothetical protein
LLPANQVFASRSGKPDENRLNPFSPDINSRKTSDSTSCHALFVVAIENEQIAFAQTTRCVSKYVLDFLNQNIPLESFCCCAIIRGDFCRPFRGCLVYFEGHNVHAALSRVARSEAVFGNIYGDYLQVRAERMFLISLKFP